MHNQATQLTFNRQVSFFPPNRLQQSNLANGHRSKIRWRSTRIQALTANQTRPLPDCARKCLPQSWLQRYGEPTAGATYAARIPSLANATKTRAENNNADLSSPDFGPLITSGTVGGGLESTVAVLRAIDCSALLHQQRIEERFTECDTKLRINHYEIGPRRNNNTQKTGETHSTDSLIANAQAAWKYREKSTRLTRLRMEAPERITDLGRYTVVSWSARAFATIKQAGSAVPWVTLTAGILGVVAGVFQTISGAVKLRAAKKEIATAELDLRRIKEAQPNNSDEVLQGIYAHVQQRRVAALERAKDKRFRAKIEAVSGIGVTVFSIAAFGFPPLLFGSIAIGFLYAGYRSVLGVRALATLLAMRKTEKKIRNDLASNPTLTTEKVKEHPIYAVRYLIQQIAKTRESESLPWLQNFLQQIGVPKADTYSMMQLAIKNPGEAENVLYEMLFGDSFVRTYEQEIKATATTPPITNAASTEDFAASTEDLMDTTVIVEFSPDALNKPMKVSVLNKGETKAQTPVSVALHGRHIDSTQRYERKTLPPGRTDLDPSPSTRKKRKPPHTTRAIVRLSRAHPDMAPEITVTGFHGPVPRIDFNLNLYGSTYRCRTGTLASKGAPKQ